MLQKIEVADPGESTFLKEEHVDKLEFTALQVGAPDKQAVFEILGSPTPHQGFLLAGRVATRRS